MGIGDLRDRPLVGGYQAHGKLVNCDNGDRYGSSKTDSYRISPLLFL